MSSAGYIGVIWIFVLLQVFTTSAKEVCDDLYMRYCRSLTADKCYLAYNQKLCCDTCRDFQEMYSYTATEDRSCKYGNRNKECAQMDTNLCYNIYNRYACCETCAKIKTDKKNCQYGDKDVSRCLKVKPYHCYKREVEKMCCSTCAQYGTGRKDCPYGDKIMFFSKARKKYSCVAYVGHFGHARCRMPWDKSFRQICCGSCYNKFSRFDYY